MTRYELGGDGRSHIATSLEKVRRKKGGGITDGIFYLGRYTLIETLLGHLPISGDRKKKLRYQEEGAVRIYGKNET